MTPPSKTAAGVALHPQTFTQQCLRPSRQSSVCVAHAGGTSCSRLSLQASQFSCGNTTGRQSAQMWRSACWPPMPLALTRMTCAASTTAPTPAARPQVGQAVDQHDDVEPNITLHAAGEHLRHAGTLCLLQSCIGCGSSACASCVTQPRSSETRQPCSTAFCTRFPRQTRWCGSHE